MSFKQIVKHQVQKKFNTNVNQEQDMMAQKFCAIISCDRTVCLGSCEVNLGVYEVLVLVTVAFFR